MGSKQMRTMRNYVTESIGTFFLVLTIGLTVLGESPMAPPGGSAHPS
jgi:hypothetical protein